MAKKASFGQDLAWRIEALGYDVLSFILGLLPIDAVSGFGGWLLRTIGPLTPTHNVVLQNLRWAFPEKDEAERARIAMGVWDNIGRSFAEFPVVHRITPQSGRVEMVGAEHFEEARTLGKPVIFISGHFANWELLPAAIVQSGSHPHMTYRPANNPYVDARMKKVRARYGMTRFAPKGENTRDLMQAMRKNVPVAFLIDQKFNEGIMLPFFGKPAATTTGAARLALQYDAPIYPMTGQRLGGARFRIIALPPIHLQKTGDKQRDLEAGTLRLNQFLEECIRAKPEDWFWVHRRWPKADYETR